MPRYEFFIAPKIESLGLFSLSVLVVMDLWFFGSGIEGLDVSKVVGVESVGRSPANGGVVLDEDGLVRLGLVGVVLLVVALRGIILGTYGLVPLNLHPWIKYVQGNKIFFQSTSLSQIPQI